MITKQTHGHSTWVDVISPTAEEIQSLIHTYALTAEVARDLVSPTIHPRIDECDTHLYTVLHFPAYKHSHKSFSQEIDFVIGKDFLITVRYDTIDSLHVFSKTFEVSKTLSKNEVYSSGHEIFTEILKEMYQAIFDELSAIEDKLDHIENNIFNGQQKAMVTDISSLSRTLLDFKRVLRPHHDILAKLEVVGTEQYGKAFGKEMEIIRKEYVRAIEVVHSTIEFVIELRETNNTLLFTRQNEIMKVFTVLAFTTFPLSLITQIITADPEYTWLLLAIVFFAIVFMVGFFKHKKWL